MRIWLTAILVVAVLASPAFAGKGKQPGFQDACADFAKLLRRTDCPREQWLQVIKKFVALHKQATDPTVRMRSLLLAGKAALDLHKRSARTEDLELAIRSLDQFCRSCRQSPELHHGVRLLGEARAIKEGLKKRPAENFVAQAPQPVLHEDSNGTNHGAANPPNRPSSKGGDPRSPLSQRGCRGDFGVQSALHSDSRSTPAPASQSPPPWTHTAARAPIRPEVPTPPQSPRVQTPGLPESPTGNPFCASGQQSLFRIPLPERHAAVPRRIVTDAPRPAVPQAPPPRQFVVVIDPGHGGKDPGAVSADGQLKEKDITLKVGLELRRILERANPRVKVLLTRDQDVFVALEDRKAFAHSVNADLFISIHCNSSAESVAKGIETYFFSTASSRRAMDLAARENRSSATKNVDVRTLRLAHTSNIAAASSLAALVHRGVMEKLGGTVSGGRDRGVKSGPFHILHAAKMPAILVECSFISNPAERTKLRNPVYLQRVAEGIAAGAKNYLRDLDEKG